MPRCTREASLLGPPTIPVHDDRDVTRNLPVEADSVQ